MTETVLTLLDTLERQVPPGAPCGTRWSGRAAVRVGAAGQPRVHAVQVAARIDERGQRRVQFSVDGVRLERSVLLRLTCAETECPQARAVHAQWQQWHRAHPKAALGSAAGAGMAPARTAEPTWAPEQVDATAAQPAPLLREQPVVVGRHHLVARPARFACFTPCPHGAHPPMTIDKTGYDLFEDGQCVGGGLHVEQGVPRPRLPNLPACEAYVLARHLEGLAALEQARDGGSPP